MGQISIPGLPVVSILAESVTRSDKPPAGTAPSINVPCL